MPLTLIAAYLIGSVPFAFLLSRRWGAADLRRVGSGNLGAANVLRSSGLTAGLLVAILDIAKGAASVLLAERLSAGTAVPAAAGFAAMVGHVYPIWLRFRGGKGVATACGAFSVLTPLAVLPALAIFLTAASITKYISVGSLLASLALPPVAYATGSPARPLRRRRSSCFAIGPTCRGCAKGPSGGLARRSTHGKPERAHAHGSRRR
jgi:acyl phosphate:glycerol-3-phosphate acyltransferase